LIIIRILMIFFRHMHLKKKKFLRANNKPHVSKVLRKAIMQRSKLKNIANKSGKPEDMVRYRKQRNLVVSLNRQAKRDFLSMENLETAILK